MKKNIFTIISFFVILICSNIFSVIAYQKWIEAYEVNFPIRYNFREITFQSPVVTIDDKTYVPLRELSNALGFHVNWNALTNEINITSTVPSVGDVEEEKALIQKRRTDYTLDDFAFIKKGMSMQEVIKQVGQPSYYIGSGFPVPIYVLCDGNRLMVDDRGSSNTIKNVRLFYEDGTYKDIELEQ